MSWGYKARRTRRDEGDKMLALTDGVVAFCFWLVMFASLVSSHFWLFFLSAGTAGTLTIGSAYYAYQYFKSGEIVIYRERIG